MVTRRDFDAVVIGAGPAGAMAALTLARVGLRTLMVDKAPLGRWKVCGCCLSITGRVVLDVAGLSGVLAGATPIRELTLAARGARTSVELLGMVSISRESLDAALAQAAEAEGVEVIRGAAATATPEGVVTIGKRQLIAGVVVDASGLATGGGSKRRGRIGLGMCTSDASCPPHMLTMAVARGGYLGRVALPEGRVEFAMAAKPSFIRAAGTPTAAARAVWAAAGLDPKAIPEGRWRGTPALMRRAVAQHGRILRVGDAAGYVEPFTGEGMSWALLGASRIAPDAMACAAHGPESSCWPRTLHALVGRPHARCRAVSRAARSPGLVRAAIGLANLAPSAGVRTTLALSGAARRPA